MNAYYVTCCIPLIFGVLSFKFHRKLVKLDGSGKVPRIVSARANQDVFLFLAILSAFLNAMYYIS